MTQGRHISELMKVPEWLSVDAFYPACGRIRITLNGNDVTRECVAYAKGGDGYVELVDRSRGIDRSKPKPRYFTYKAYGSVVAEWIKPSRIPVQ